MNVKNLINNETELKKQESQWLNAVQQLGLKVTCPECKNKVNFWCMYRCFYCGFLFCPTCAKKHFIKRERRKNG